MAILIAVFALFLIAAAKNNKNNGFFFELYKLNGSSEVLRVVSRKSPAADNQVASGSFNGDHGITYIMDNLVHTYEIWWTNKNTFFFIDDVLLHTLTGSTTTLSNTLSLPVGMQVINGGSNASANTLEVRSGTLNRLGRIETAPIWKYQVGANAGQVLKYGPGRLHRVVCNKSSGTTITLYDAVSATNPICIIDPTNASSIEYQLDFYTGLYVVTVGSGIDCTIVYE